MLEVRCLCTHTHSFLFWGEKKLQHSKGLMLLIRQTAPFPTTRALKWELCSCQHQSQKCCSWDLIKITDTVCKVSFISSVWSPLRGWLGSWKWRGGKASTFIPRSIKGLTSAQLSDSTECCLSAVITTGSSYFKPHLCCTWHHPSTIFSAE